jgi:hypothetical protein
MIGFNEWCKELGVATLCDYEDRKVREWVKKIEEAKHIEWINYQKAYSKVNGHILGLETAMRDERNR